MRLIPQSLLSRSVLNGPGSRGCGVGPGPGGTWWRHSVRTTLGICPSVALRGFFDTSLPRRARLAHRAARPPATGLGREGCGIRAGRPSFSTGRLWLEARRTWIWPQRGPPPWSVCREGRLRQGRIVALEPSGKVCPLDGTASASAPSGDRDRALSLLPPRPQARQWMGIRARR